jgi:threonine synthase
MSKLLFYSTNRQSEEVGFIQALFQGQAPDRGLYMPKTIPSFGPGELDALSGKSYPEVASRVLGKFLDSTEASADLDRLCRDAYPFAVPLEQVSDSVHVMRLDRGPTASFKDFAARMMARLMAGQRRNADRRLVILTATSGDTGSAIAHAFFNVPGIEVVVLFPPGEVSSRQRKQMTTLGHNIAVIGIDGKFDDCQALVKRAFSDPSLNSVDLTSANSINIGRLLPQAVYYVYAFTRLAQKDVVFSVPSGNFGNMMGCLLAKRMGLPVRRLVIATNENDEVPKYLETGLYRKIVPSKNCISNAMNVGHPSNFARVIDFYGGRMDETGALHEKPDLGYMRRDLWATSISDGETRESIKKAWDAHGLLLEPHGAVGWAGLERFRSETGDTGASVSVETAHPAKFPEEIENLLGFTPDMPDSLAEVDKKKEEYTVMPADYQAFQRFLAGRFSS